jgi:amidase
MLEPQISEQGTGVSPFRSTSQLANAIMRHEITATELIETHLERVRRHNPALNAIVTLDEQGAVHRAGAADAALARGEVWGPLHGVPVTIKDDWETAGLRTTNAERRWRDYVPDTDATVVARLRAAGAIIIAKTNMPERGGDVQTNSRLLGRANNPWNLSCTPGGSTGGGAAAVAAGLSPLEIGSDGGGSVRLPAHFCGVFAFKPTEHAVSLAGNMLQREGSSLRHLSTPGVISRSADDLALAFRIVAGGDDRDFQVPGTDMKHGTAKALPDLKIAWASDVGGLAVTDATHHALEQAATQLERAGCRVVRAAPSLDVASAWRMYGDILGGEAGASFPGPLRFIARVMSRFAFNTPPVIRGVQRGFGGSLPSYLAALDARDALIAEVEAFLKEFDAWLCPVAAGPAFPHERSAPYIAPPKLRVDGRRISYWTYALGHASLLNLTGNPVVVMPLARSREGLPIGAQLVGRRWQDLQLLSLAQQIAQVTGQFVPPPGYS